MIGTLHSEGIASADRQVNESSECYLSDGPASCSVMIALLLVAYTVHVDMDAKPLKAQQP